MCGIIGYCGPLDAQTVLLNGLTQLEYRGYDSAGIALFDENSKIHFIKKVGKSCCPAQSMRGRSHRFPLRNRPHPLGDPRRRDK